MAAPLHCTQCGLEQEDDARFCPGCGTAIVAPKAIAQPAPTPAPTVQTAAAPSDEKSLLGTVVADRYRLVETIGQGDSGIVFRAEHTTLTKKVAVKILHAQMSRDEAAIERFRREATTVAEIDNDHILQVSDFGRTPDGRLFFAMELLDGKTLTEVLEKEKRLTVTRALDIAIQIGEALVEAHGLGYVHRDLKPRNVFLIQRRGRADFVKLLDFGLAKLVEPGGQMRQTAMGMTFGDPRYMAPEAVKGDAIDRRVDIYALGAILCEMLTGAPPYEGSGTFDILQKQLDGSVPRLRDRRPELPEWLDRVVQKALAKQADDRFVTALKMIEHLREQAAPVGEVTSKREVTPAPALAPKPSETPPPASGGGVGKETLMLGRLRNPNESEANGNGSANGNGANSAAPSPSVSPIVSTQKMAAIGKGAGPVGTNDKTQSQKQSNKQQQKNKQANAPGKAAPNDSTRPAPLAVSGTASPRHTPKDSAVATSTSGEMSIGERGGREPSQKVPTVMFDSAVEALGPEQAPPKPVVEKNNRRPGAVQTKPGVQGKSSNASVQTKQGLQPHQVQPKPNDSGEHDKPKPEPAAPVIEASGEERRDEPSGESQWFNNGPVLDEDEELEPVRKSRAGMYAGLGVGGVVVLLVLMIALWPRQKPIAEADKREANDKPATAAPSVATASASPATPAPAPAPEPLKPSSVIVSPLPTPEPTPSAPTAPVAEDEGKIVKAKVEDRRKPIEEREPMPRDPAPAPAPVAVAPPPAKLAPSKQAVEELKSPAVASKDPAKDPKETKTPKALPAGFKDPFSEAPRPTNSGQAEGLVRLGRQKLAAGDINGALAQFNKAREADPASADALAGMGEVSFEQGDYNAAAQFLKQALRGSPNRPRYIVLLGQAYYKLGRARDAANEYRRALRLDPDNEEAQRSLELAEKKLGN